MDNSEDTSGGVMQIDLIQNQSYVQRFDRHDLALELTAIAVQKLSVVRKNQPPI